jgi:hypothetical protein
MRRTDAKPSPSRGEGWVGVNPPPHPETRERRSAARVSAVERRASTPIPDPSPLEGEGRRFA